MQYVYVCSAVPEKMNDMLGRSVAGNKFSINMAQALDDCCGGNVTFISTATVTQSAIKQWGGEIWPGKKLNLVQRGKRFFVAELKARKSILRMIHGVKETHPGEDVVVLIENSPFSAATACKSLKKQAGFSCFSITIDTPFTQSFRRNGIRGHINTWMFMQGRKSLRSFDGLISFTEDVKKELKVDIPFCSFAIGCRQEAVPEKLPAYTTEKTAVYAGTLIYYNGIRELLQAYTLLDQEYQLHIYGYGPLEEEVKKFACEYSNITFHGRFDPENSEQILSQYELLINPRMVDPSIENYTFPSKLVDYILTGKSVLSTDFKTLPDEYREFVYILKDLNPETIADGIRKVFSEPIAIRQSRGWSGIKYLVENQTYSKIVDKILSFTEKCKGEKLGVEN